MQKLLVFLMDMTVIYSDHIFSFISLRFFIQFHLHACQFRERQYWCSRILIEQYVLYRWCIIYFPTIALEMLKKYDASFFRFKFTFMLKTALIWMGKENQEKDEDCCSQCIIDLYRKLLQIQNCDLNIGGNNIVSDFLIVNLKRT